MHGLSYLYIELLVTMDLHHFFGPASSSASVAAVTANSSSEEDDDDFEGVARSTVQLRREIKSRSKGNQVKVKGNTSRGGKKISSGWNMTRTIGGAFL